MYSERHYLCRSVLAMELAQMPGNISRKSAYLALSLNWKQLAEIAAEISITPVGAGSGKPPPPLRQARQGGQSETSPVTRPVTSPPLPDSTALAE